MGILPVRVAIPPEREKSIYNQDLYPIILRFSPVSCAVIIIKFQIFHLMFNVLQRYTELPINCFPCFRPSKKDRIPLGFFLLTMLFNLSVTFLKLNQ